MLDLLHFLQVASFACFIKCLPKNLWQKVTGATIKLDNINSLGYLVEGIFLGFFLSMENQKIVFALSNCYCILLLEIFLRASYIMAVA